MTAAIYRTKQQFITDALISLLSALLYIFVAKIHLQYAWKR